MTQALPVIFLLACAAFWIFMATGGWRAGYFVSRRSDGPRLTRRDSPVTFFIVVGVFYAVGAAMLAAAIREALTGSP